MTGSEARAFLEEVFDAVSAPSATPEVIQRYFTDDYVQIVNTTFLHRTEFETHLATLRSDFRSFSFDFTTVIAEGNRIADAHLTTATRKNGRQMKIEFIGVYTLRDGRIAKYEALSCLIEGAEEERDYGSRIR